jgi:hypothetical protein
MIKDADGMVTRKDMRAQDLEVPETGATHSSMRMQAVKAVKPRTVKAINQRLLVTTTQKNNSSS